MTMFLVKTGVDERDGHPVYRAFETLKEAAQFGRSIGATEVVQMEVTSLKAPIGSTVRQIVENN